MTSVPSISRLLMSAWAPVICMVLIPSWQWTRGPGCSPEMENPPLRRRVGKRNEAGASVRYGTTRMREAANTAPSLG